MLSTLVDKDPAPVLEVICINADGSLASMCGNALRCVAWAAAVDHGFTAMTLMMAGVPHAATVNGNHVSVTAEAGEVEPERVETWWQETRLRFDAVHTGTEHVVALVDDVDAVDVDRLGSLVRYHDALAPVGTNVNFVHPVDPHAVRIRTYERGVEAETLSCGSGAVAAAVIASRRGVVAPGPVTVHNRAGMPLTVTPNGERPGVVLGRRSRRHVLPRRAGVAVTTTFIDAGDRERLAREITTLREWDARGLRVVLAYGGLSAEDRLYLDKSPVEQLSVTALRESPGRPGR